MVTNDFLTHICQKDENDFLGKPKSSGEKLRQFLSVVDVAFLEGGGGGAAVICKCLGGDVPLGL